MEQNPFILVLKHFVNCTQCSKYLFKNSSNYNIQVTKTHDSGAFPCPLKERIEKFKPMSSIALIRELCNDKNDAWYMSIRVTKVVADHGLLLVVNKQDQRTMKIATKIFLAFPSF